MFLHLQHNSRMTDSPETLQGYEEQFACRFTSEDVEYQKYVQQPVNPPPIVEDWRGRSGGGYQRGRDNRYASNVSYNDISSVTDSI